MATLQCWFAWSIVDFVGKCWLILLSCLNLCGFVCYYFCAGILLLFLLAAFGVTLLWFWVWRGWVV